MWDYSDRTTADPMLARTAFAGCAYCNKKMTAALTFNDWETRPVSESVLLCSSCGWWNSQRMDMRNFGGIWAIVNSESGCGVLRRLDVSDQSIPILEIQRYLRLRYQDRFKVHPKIFEEVVASVFSDHGWDPFVTPYASDDGIDVVLVNSAGKQVGVQVKRHQGKIEAAQIREFAGSLMLNGLTRGVFVTTSGFTRGASGTANRYTRRSLPIQLVDAERFYDAMGINRLSLKQLDENEIRRRYLSSLFSTYSGDCL